MTSGLIVLAGPSRSARAQDGTTLVTETFTGATVDPRFEGYGSACITGAPAGAPPGPGEHPLGSCGTTRVGPVPPAGGAPFGYLQLTDASANQAGAVLFNQPIPATEGLEVTFEQWQYGSTTPATPADGISFFLVDGAGGLTAPGAFGGSLGYAQKLPDDDPTNTFLPGVDNGYLGVGLDVLGNYFGDWEHRGNGCTRRSPAGTGFRVLAPGANMVTVRGPGNGTEGYCFLTATTSNFSTSGPWPSTLPGQLQGPLTSLPQDVTPEQAAALLEPSKRTVTVRITPAPNPQVSVDIDFNDGDGAQRVLDFAAPEPEPATYKLGFAASTGGFTDVHLIRNVRIGSAQALPELNLAKQVVIDPPLPAVIGVGTDVPYQFVVTNSGSTTVGGLVVTDPAIAGVSCPTTTLAPRETTICTATYRVTQADVDRGVVVNSAVASGSTTTGPVTSPESQVTLPLGNGTAELSLTKVADPSTVSAAGQEVRYEYVVTNTGTVTINDVRATDIRFTGTGAPPEVACDATIALAPGDQVVCDGTYTVTQSDVDAGEDIINKATASGSAPNGTVVTSEPNEAVVNVVAAPSLALVKSADPPTVTAAGQTVTYSFLAINDGNVTLTGLVIEETAFTGTGSLSPITCPTTSLTPGEKTACTATYTVTQADIDAGSITNTAVANSTLPGGGTLTSAPSSAAVTTESGAGLTMVKSAEPATVTAAGQTVTYSFLAINDGNVTVTGLAIQETAFTGTGTPPVVTCPVTVLAPGDQVACTGTYTVTQSDVDTRKGISNTAMATATAPGGTVTSDPATAEVDIVAAPSLALVKSADPPAVTAAGQTVTYSFLAINNGNVTVTGLAIEEIAFAGTGSMSPITCRDAMLAPDEQTTCSATYTVTQADIDAGSIINTAVAKGTLPDARTVTSPRSSAAVDTESGAGLTMVKSAEPATVTEAGQTVTYSFLVTNDGNVTVTGLDIEEIAFTGTGRMSPITCPDDALAPGESTACTATYTVTQADIDAGSITNGAVANGVLSGGGTVRSNVSTASVAFTGISKIGIRKTGRVIDVNHDHRPNVGDRIEWTIVVTNRGATTLTDITVSDPKAGPVTCPGAELAPGASMTCTVAPHTITKADLKACRVTNEATASGRTPTGTVITSETASVSIPLHGHQVRPKPIYYRLPWPLW